MNLYAIIIAGGRGERFWPKSRQKEPKQFLKIFGKESLLRLTCQRVKKLTPIFNQRYIVPVDLAEKTKQTLNLKKENLIVEPETKNTAPAIALASVYLSNQVKEDALTIVLPADHIIKNIKEFIRCVKFAQEIALDDYLVTFGIPPQYPATGYGYIETKRILKERNGLMAFEAKRFVEKPDFKRAKKYLKEGRYLWNSGMFVWKLNYFLKQVQEYLPQFYDELVRFKKTIGTRGEKKALANLYRNAPNISVDYAIMEKAERIAVVKATFDWDDVGSWLALERYFKKDEAGNIKVGKVFIKDGKDSIIYTDSLPIVALGIRDMIIVKSAGAEVVFIAQKGEIDKIKELIKDLQKFPDWRKYL